MLVFDLFTYAYLPKIGDVILDVGSGEGAEIERFSNLVGDAGHVLAIEADPDLYMQNCNLIKKLNLRNVSCHNFAICNFDGIVDLQVFSDNGIDSSIHRKDGKTVKKVRSMKLDTFLQHEKIEKVDFIKVNIEGAEVDLLEGSRKSLKSIKNWCISTHDFCGIPTRDIVERFLNENSMDYFFQRENPALPWEGGYVYAIHQTTA